jgi:predicted ferric reductase
VTDTAPQSRLDSGRAPAWIALSAIALGLALVLGAGAAGFRMHGAMVRLRGAGAWWVTLGRSTALMAAMLLMVQFALSARLRILDRAFGLDRLLRLHAATGALAGVLACAHPFLTYAGGYSVGPLRVAIWPQLLGAGVLLILGLIVCTSVWRGFLLLPYEAWKWIHYLAFVGAVAGTIHGVKLGADFRGGWLKVPWMIVFALYVALFAWAKVLRPMALRKRRYTISSVERLNRNVCRLTLTPGSGAPAPHRPGQFVFLRLAGGPVGSQEHPFTLSSAPRSDGRLTLTIKASGDYTSAIMSAKVGQRATIDGPYGRFSYLDRAEKGGTLVFIAGGVGVTPMLSMLRFLSETEPERDVTFLWANRTREDVFAADELDQLTAQMPNLRVHHVLSREPDYDGEVGRLDVEKLRRLAGDRTGADVFLCGPTGMMDSVAAALRKVGFARGRIHAERFAL